MKTKSTGGRMRHELMTQGGRGGCFLEPLTKVISHRHGHEMNCMCTAQ